MHNELKAYLPIFSVLDQPHPGSMNHLTRICKPPSSPVDFTIGSSSCTISALSSEPPRVVSFPPILLAMSPKGGKSGGLRGPTAPTAPLRALGRSTVVNLEGLEKIRLVVAAGSNEWGATKIWPGSWPRGEMATSTVPLHIHALLSSVLPPFSSFINAVLSHYQIHALHLDPSSLVLLSAFAFLCEAFVGVTPSVALLRHLFSLELDSEEQCSGCASLRTTDASTPGALDAELLPEAKGFRRLWVHVEIAEAGAQFQPSSTPTTPNPRLPTGDRGGGSVLPAPEIAEHIVFSSPAPSGVQPPESLAHEPTAVFLARGLRLPTGVPFPLPAAPPRVMQRLPSEPPLLCDVGPQGSLLSYEAPAGEPPIPEHGFGLRDSSRASPARRVESESSRWPLEPVEGLRATSWGLLRTAAEALQRLGMGLATNKVRLEDEHRHLASGWCQLEVVVNLARLQRERARAEVERSLAVAAEARECALSEAQEANCRCRASKDHHR
ncbi:hypothetical protein D1007_37702 [Hordeum vulgare]|nr:hypothetical protein D1007_37702 [Hordeum vulgare]